MDLKNQQVSGSQIQYLYMRSLFADIANNDPTAKNYYLNNAKQYKNRLSIYQQSMLGLVLLNLKENNVVLRSYYPSIMENAVKDQHGIHWKSDHPYFWNESSVETASMVIELASTIIKAQKNETIEADMDGIRTWLLLNKQTKNWGTTITTANACYALLMSGAQWLNDQRNVSIQLGNMEVNSNKENSAVGLGYFEKELMENKSFRKWGI